MSLMKADEPRALQGRRARLSRRMADERGAEAGRARARPQPHASRSAATSTSSPKIGATDGKSFQQMAGSMTGMSRGGIPRHDDQRAAARSRATACRRTTRGEEVMARITAGVYTSHVPADRRGASTSARPTEPYWRRCSRATSSPSSGCRTHKPDVIFLVYNDHATAFSLEMIPTFAIGSAAEFQPADEGWGPRPVPMVHGHPELAAHIAQIGDPGRFRPHHRQQDGRRPRPHRAAVLMFGQPAAWPCQVIPFAVNVVQYPRAVGPPLLQLWARRSARPSRASTRISTCRSGAPAA